MKGPGDILKIYDESVDLYSSTRGRSLMEKKYLDHIIRLIPKNAHILDIGCGIGEPIAAYFSSQGLKVTGVDGSENMIKKAHELEPNSTWLVADMRNLDLQQTFDAVIAWDSFFHLSPEDQRKMFDIFLKHLKYQGVLAFTSGPDAGEAVGSFNGHELYHSSLSAYEYRDILSKKGFEVLVHQVEDPDCGGHTVWVAQLK